MTPDHAEFAEWDAAYVLGALTPADRSRYERHLDECDRCRAACAELAALPGLLAAARPLTDAPEDADVDVLGEGASPRGPRGDLVHALTERRARRRRRIRTRITLGLASAAVVAGAIAIPLAVAQPPAPTTVALAPVVDTPMTATVSLTSVGWGTRIEMRCGYPADYGAGDAGPWSYALVVTDEEGDASQVSTWNAVPGSIVRLDAATAVALDDIARIEVRSAGGDPLLVAALDD